MITNYQNIEIKKKQIYNGVFEYSVPEPYYFESYGQSYGNIIYGMDETTNHYIVKKKEDEDSPEKNIHQ